MAGENKTTYEDDVEDDMYDDSSYIFFKDRPEWQDVLPVEQDDGPYSAVKINYSPKFRDVYDYLRAVIKLGEKSHRVLVLTGHAIVFNAANYTAWQYRRDVLKELNIPHKMKDQTLSPEFEEEMSFSREMIEENNKNYQVWHHRKILVSWSAGYDEVTEKMTLEDPKDCQLILKKELRLTSSLLNKDAKNYHAWQHRQWVLTLFNCFENELKFAASLIDFDVRNNSAWNQRFFVVQNTKRLDDKLIEKEISYTTEQILKAVSNESAWSYLRGLLDLEDKWGEINPFVEQCLELIKAESPSVPLHVFIIEVYEDKIARGEKNEELLNHGKSICDHLSEKLDSLRKGYWNLKKKSFEINAAS